MVDGARTPTLSSSHSAPFVVRCVEGSIFHIAAADGPERFDMAQAESVCGLFTTQPKDIQPLDVFGPNCGPGVRFLRGDLNIGELEIPTIPNEEAGARQSPDHAA